VLDKGARRLSDEEWRGYFETLSNWGRWGPDDQRGTLNLIDSRKVLAASQLVREGRHVSCGRLVEFGNRVSVYEAEDAPLHFVSSTGSRLNSDGAGGGLDWVGFQIHGLYITHLDAPSHQIWGGTMYNGHPAQALTAEAGAQAGSIDLAGSGIVSRGILLDIAQVAGVDALPAGYGIGPEDLDAAAAAHGVSPEAGDVLLVRTGYGSTRSAYRQRIPDIDPAAGASDRGSLPHLPGLAPASLPWFRARDIAVVGTDTGTDCRPSSHDWIAPFHVVAMCAIGMWVLDNFELEDLAQVCRETGRYEFMIVIAPVRFKNTTGSPVNPIAVF
jgi:kynurenine formamidase